MIRPSIKTYHEDLRLHRIHPLADHLHFLGKTALDLRWKGEDSKPGEEDEILFEMEVAMPGFEKENISITVLNDILTVRGKKKREEKPKSKFLLKEFDVDIIERKFKIDPGLVNEKVKVIYKNGMIKIIFTNIPTRKVKTARKIPLS